MKRSIAAISCLKCINKPSHYSRIISKSFTTSTPYRSGSNSQLAFPCVDANEQRTRQYENSLSSGPEPSYSSSPAGVKIWHSDTQLDCDYGGSLPSYDIAYETWGSINANKDNVILLHTGLSASSHAHSTPENSSPGWWEKYIGSGKPLDTDKYHIICTNVLGGCFGSTGPGGIDPADGQRYATRFPILTIFDMVRAQFQFLSSLGIHKLYSSVGSSMGGMASLAAANLFPDRVGSVISISGCAKSHPYSIALRHTQRQIIMADVNWSGVRGNYYSSVLPHAGMKLARQIATISYRSGPEWEDRFGSRRADVSQSPAFCPDFLIETYLDHAGEKFIGTYDPNSLLYISKAMDLFNLSASYARELKDLQQSGIPKADLCRVDPYVESPNPPVPSIEDLAAGLRIKSPVLVVGVQSDNLMPVTCQREIADSLKLSGNQNVTYSELSLAQSVYGHDTFLLSEEVGTYVQRFLERV